MYVLVADTTNGTTNGAFEIWDLKLNRNFGVPTKFL